MGRRRIHKTNKRLERVSLLRSYPQPERRVHRFRTHDSSEHSPGGEGVEAPRTFIASCPLLNMSCLSLQQAQRSTGTSDRNKRECDLFLHGKCLTGRALEDSCTLQHYTGTDECIAPAISQFDVIIGYSHLMHYIGCTCLRYVASLE